MADACVTQKIYLSGEPVSLDDYDVYAQVDGEPVRISSWKQLPESETPALAVPKGEMGPAAVHFNPDMFIPASWLRGSTSSASAKGRSGRNSHRVHPELEALPTDDRTRAALSQIVARPPAGHGLLISSPYGGGSRAAARAVAGLLAPADSVFYAYPSEDRWTVEEVDELVARPAYMKSPSGVRPVIVVEDVELMPASVADRLLKILEEPPGGALFILTTTNPDRLRPALRGRMAGHVPIAPISSPDRRRHYEKLGVAPDQAERIDTLAATNVTLGSAVAEMASADPAVLEEAEAALSPTVRNPAEPVTSAQEAASRIDALAGRLVKADWLRAEARPEDTDEESGSKRRLEEERKATVRMLCRLLIDATVEELRRSHLHAAVASGQVDRDSLERLLTAVRTAARDAKAGVGSYIPSERVLAGFYTRLTALGF